MGWENNWQLNGLFLSCGFGFLTGVWYDVLRVIRTVLRFGKIGVFLSDMLFCVSTATAFFFFSFPLTGGAVRGYLLLGTALGFVVYLYTVGRVFVWFCLAIVRFIKRLTGPLFRLVSAIFGKIATLLSVPVCFVRKKTKKIVFFLKKLLHIAP